MAVSFLGDNVREGEKPEEREIKPKLAKSAPVSSILQPRICPLSHDYVTLVTTLCTEFLHLMRLQTAAFHYYP